MGEGRLNLEKKFQGVSLQKIPKEWHPTACTASTGRECWIPEPSPIGSALPAGCLLSRLCCAADPNSRINDVVLQSVKDSLKVGL